VFGVKVIRMTHKIMLAVETECRQHLKSSCIYRNMVATGIPTELRREKCPRKLNRI
jgi:hypothetical protein